MDQKIQELQAKLEALAAPEREKAQALAAEGITPEVLEVVDLTQGYSPVLPVRCGIATTALKNMDGSYTVLHHGGHSQNVTAAELRIMRCRWLLARDAYRLAKIKELL